MTAQIIDTFYALDFDRCLGDYEASVDLTKEIIDDLTALDGRTFRLLHDKSTAIKKTFHVMEYIKTNDPSVDIEAFQQAYVKRALARQANLLEPGAGDLINFLSASDQNYCILSFGDKNWQVAKIDGAGLSDVIKVITDNELKGRLIAEWFDEESGHFVVPSEYFVDGISRKAREVVLVDDKVKAFDSFHQKARGYLLQDVSRLYAATQGKVPPMVKRVNRLDEIIEHESRIIRNSKKHS